MGDSNTPRGSRRNRASRSCAWQDATATHAYTVRDIGALVESEIMAHGAASGGLSWHFCRPPVTGLDYEMDVRGVAREIVIF